MSLTSYASETKNPQKRFSELWSLVYFCVLAIDFGRKRKFVHQADRGKKSCSCFLIIKTVINCEKKTCQTLKQGSQANFVDVFCAHILL